MGEYQYKVHWIPYSAAGRLIVQPRCGEETLDPRDSSEMKRFSEDINKVTCLKCKQIYDMSQESKAAEDLCVLRIHFKGDWYHPLCGTHIPEAARKARLTSNIAEVDCVKCKALMKSRGIKFPSLKDPVTIDPLVPETEPQVLNTFNDEIKKVTRWIKETAADLAKHESINSELMVVPTERIKFFLSVMNLLLKTDE